MVSKQVASSVREAKSGTHALVALLAEVWKWRNLILATTLISTAAGAAYAFSRTPKLLVKSIIEIGTLGASTGFRLAETPDVVVNKINSVYALTAARDLSQTAAGKTPRTIAARSVRNTNSIIIESFGSKQDVPDMEALHRKVFELVSADHSRQFNVAKSDLGTQLKQLTVELDRLKDQNALDVELSPLTTALSASRRDLAGMTDKRQSESSQKVLQAQITAATNSLEDLEAERKLLELNLKQRDTSDTKLAEKLSRLNSFLENATTSRQKLLASSKSTGDSVAALVLGTEIQRLTIERDAVEQQILVGSNAERSRLEANLAGNVRKQAAPLAAIDKAKSDLLQLDAARDSKIAELNQSIAQVESKIAEAQRARKRAIDIQAAKITDLNTKLQSVTDTCLLAPPQMKDGRADVSSSLVTALAALFGLFAGCALAVAGKLYEMVQAKLALPEPTQAGSTLWRNTVPPSSQRKVGPPVIRNWPTRSVPGRPPAASDVLRNMLDPK